MNYDTHEYWEKRYDQDSRPFEWYLTYADLSGTLAKYINKESTVLHVGCGSSKFAESIHENLSAHVVNIDFAENIIVTMQKRYANCTFVFADIITSTNSMLPHRAYNVIFDKGTLDCIMCSDVGTELAASALKNISSLLSPGGVFLCVSFVAPRQRLHLFDHAHYDWTVQEPLLLQKMPSQKAVNDAKEKKRLAPVPSVYYVYILTKKMRNAKR